MKKTFIIIFIIIITILFVKSCTTVVTKREISNENNLTKLKTVPLTTPEKTYSNDDFQEKNIIISQNTNENYRYTESDITGPEIQTPPMQNTTKEEHRTQFHPTQNIAPDNQKNSLENHLSKCKPYKEELISDFMGIEMKYTINIDGWRNNKCILNFNSSANKAGENFEQTYGIAPDDAIIKTFAPNIHCEFTQQQLDYVGDSILEENTRGKQNMLKNPKDIDFSTQTGADLRLLDVLINQKACEILNINELDSFGY